MKKPLVLFFFLSVLIGGCIILPDFGMSWDEHPQREHGLVSADYVNEFFDLGRPLERDWIKLRDYKSKHYGVLFQLVNYYIGDFLDLKSQRQEYLLRHYLGFIFFWFASIFFYKIIHLRFKDWRIALLGAALLIFSPRIFGHAFFNPKDTVLLSGVILCLYTLIRFIEFKNLKYALLHALTCAVVINFRIVGVILPAFTLLFLGFEVAQRLITKEKKYTWLQLSQNSLIWIVFTFLFTVAFWPYLWICPFLNLKEAFVVMSAYPWNGEINLYGDWFRATQVPWYYVPAWLAATTPSLYVFAGVAGLLLILRRSILNFFKEKVMYRSQAEMIDLLAFGFFTGAIFIVVVKNSVLYNGWRQMYFIYPAFLMVAISAIAQFIFYIKTKEAGLQKKVLSHLFVAALSLQMGTVAFFMYQYHPWYHLYFSAFAGKDRVGRFEMDYWGTAHKQAFEKIAKFDHRAKIKVATMQYEFPGILNYKFLDENVKNRIELVKKNKDADYIIVDIIGRNLTDNQRKPYFPFNKESFFEFSVEGDIFLRVIRMPKKIEK